VDDGQRQCPSGTRYGPICDTGRGRAYDSTDLGPADRHRSRRTRCLHTTRICTCSVDRTGRQSGRCRGRRFCGRLRRQCHPRVCDQSVRRSGNITAIRRRQHHSSELHRNGSNRQPRGGEWLERCDNGPRNLHQRRIVEEFDRHRWRRCERPIRRKSGFGKSIGRSRGFRGRCG